MLQRMVLSQLGFHTTVFLLIFTEYIKKKSSHQCDVSPTWMLGFYGNPHNGRGFKVERREG